MFEFWFSADIDVSLHAFQRIPLDALFEATDNEKDEVAKLVTGGIKKGVVRPLPFRVFSKYSVEDAFRCTSAGPQIEKVLVEVRKDDGARTNVVSAIPRTYMDPAKCYVVVGGLGGFGLELVTWILERGATKVVITSRSGVKSGYQALCVRRWNQRPGVKVVISNVDVTTEKGAERLLTECNRMGPVGGIFNLAVVSTEH